MEILQDKKNRRAFGPGGFVEWVCRRVPSDLSTAGAGEGPKAKKVSAGHDENVSVECGRPLCQSRMQPIEASDYLGPPSQLSHPFRPTTPSSQSGAQGQREQALRGEAA